MSASIKQKLIAITILFTVSIIAYSTSFSGAFVYDGKVEVIDNPNTKTIFPLWQTLSQPHRLPVRPLPYLTFAMNYSIHGQHVFGYHAVNFVIHFLCGLLIYGIIKRTLTFPSLSNVTPKQTEIIPIVISAVWLVHPVNTQAVTYIYQRMEIMMSLFGLCAVYCLIRASTESSHAALWKSLTVVSCFAGMLCKEVMFVIPILLLWYDRVFLSTSWKDVFDKKKIFYASLASSWILLFVLIQSQSSAWKSVTPTHEVSRWNYLMTQAEVIPYYLRLILFPNRLCFEYEWPIVTSFSSIIAPGFLMLSLLAITVWAIIYRPKLGFLLGSFFLILAPTSSIHPVYQPANEHRLHLATVPLLVLFIYAIYFWASQIRKKYFSKSPKVFSRVFTCVVCCLILTLAITSRERNKVYHSFRSIWEETLTKVPNSSIAHEQISVAYREEGKIEESIEYLKKARELNPNKLRLLVNLGLLSEQIKQFDEAIHYYKELLKITPDDHKANVRLGFLYFSVKGDRKAALKHYEKAVEINPNSVDAQHPYAILLSKQDETLAKASKHFQISSKLQPANPQIHYNFALHLLRIGQLEPAIAKLKTTVQLAPNDVNARQLLQKALNARK